MFNKISKTLFTPPGSEMIWIFLFSTCSSIQLKVKKIATWIYEYRVRPKKIAQQAVPDTGGLKSLKGVDDPLPLLNQLPPPLSALVSNIS